MRVISEPVLQPIPVLNLKAQYQKIRPEIEEAIQRVMATQSFILGPEVESFENELAAYVGSDAAIGVASGSDAILLSLMALNIGSGDEVVTTPYTFFATAGSIARTGAKPVFVDIEPRTYNIDANQLHDYLRGKHPILNDRSRFDHDPRRVKALMPVHLFGQCAEMSAILEAARSREIKIIEDAAQAIGSMYQGQPAGTMGTLGCFSFYPSKNLGGVGDGGAVTTDDEVLAKKVRVLRVHGSKPKYFHSLVGLNSRLDALQAAILRVKLPYLDTWISERQEVAARYDALLKQISGCSIPWRRPGDRHVYNQYVVRVKNRDRITRALKEAKIGYEIYYPRPLHLQECFRFLGYKPGDLPNSEAAAAETIGLPMYAELEAAQQERIAQALTKSEPRPLGRARRMFVNTSASTKCSEPPAT